MNTAYEITVKQFSENGEFIGSVTHICWEDSNGEYTHDKTAKTVVNEESEYADFMGLIIDCDGALSAVGDSVNMRVFK